MMVQKIKCLACKGTGRWTSPAVTSLKGSRQPEQSLQCVACGGHKVVTREIIEDAKAEGAR